MSILIEREIATESASGSLNVPVEPGLRPRVDGKFLAVGNERFYVKGTTYGAFAPNRSGHQFPEETDVARDFRLMGQAGINSILTYTVPPVALLDQAAEHGIRVVVNTPWMGHVCFLEERHYRKKVREEVRAAIASCAEHPAVLMYCVAKELPPEIVRWHGKKRIQGFLEELCDVARQVDPGGLVSYTNFPTTEYLELPFVDVFTFNVYLHYHSQFRPYLARLQHLAGELPLVLTELGMCSLRHGEGGQAEFLKWQLDEAFRQGVAGAMIFGWTDPFFQDGCLVEEWGFGLVDAARKPKRSYWTIQEHFEDRIPFPPGIEWPRVSVVVALHNAGATLESCLESLARMRYPDTEVVVVNDGSTDNSREIIERFPAFLAIHQEQQGVSAARNAGMRAASGEIVAYIDSDAEADPDWLFYLASTFLGEEVAATGGPNFVPANDGWLAKCVYRSPGGPTQVMLDDVHAEHVPGCNMAFRKSALEEIGGFDPVFVAAGDDVDVCWRLLKNNLAIGFSPSAVVWHHRRSSVRAYWRQQVGYGKAESLLEKKFPNKFNPWGHTFWGGVIYGPYPQFRLFGSPTIYHGLWGTAGFQSMYDAGGGSIWGSLPRAMEWHLLVASLGLAAPFYPWLLLPFAAGLAYTAFYCLGCAFQANLNVLEEADRSASWYQRFKWRLSIALLHFLEPLARDWGRIQGGLTPWRGAHKEKDFRLTSAWWSRLQPFRRHVSWYTRGMMGLERNRFLESLGKTLNEKGLSVGWNSDTDEWDFKVGRGALSGAIVHLVIEHHGGPKRAVRLSGLLRPRRSVQWTLVLAPLIALLLVLAGGWAAGVVIGALSLFLWLGTVAETNRLEAAIIAAAAHVCELLDPHEQKPPHDSLES